MGHRQLDGRRVNTGNGEQPYNTNSLVAQWDFNDTSGTTLTASSSGSCTTSCNGAHQLRLHFLPRPGHHDHRLDRQQQKMGRGALMMESAASADYVSVSDPASNVLDPNSADLTLETWIKTNDVSAEIFSNNNANGTACTNNGYYLGIGASGYPVFIWTPTAPPPAATLPPPANLKLTTATGTRWLFPSPGNFSYYLRGRQIGRFRHFRHFVFRHYRNRQRLFWRVGRGIGRHFGFRPLLLPRPFRRRDSLQLSGRQYRNSDQKRRHQRPQRRHLGSLEADYRRNAVIINGQRCG